MINEGKWFSGYLSTVFDFHEYKFEEVLALIPLFLFQ